MHSTHMHVSASVLLEARGLHVTCAVYERCALVTHAHQLTLELRADHT